MNETRGEKIIKLGQTPLTLALEYERIVELEQTVGFGIISFSGRCSFLMDIPPEHTAQAMISSPLTLEQVATAIWILSGKKDYTLPLIGKLVLSVGMIAAIDPLSDFFATAVAGAPMGEVVVAGVKT